MQGNRVARNWPDCPLARAGLRTRTVACALASERIVDLLYLALESTNLREIGPDSLHAEETSPPPEWPDSSLSPGAPRA
jgi:hypothetical protein